LCTDDPGAGQQRDQGEPAEDEAAGADAHRVLGVVDVAGSDLAAVELGMADLHVRAGPALGGDAGRGRDQLSELLGEDRVGCRDVLQDRGHHLLPFRLVGFFPELVQCPPRPRSRSIIACLRAPAQARQTATWAFSIRSAVPVH
jgi:hypothetical protein